MFNQRAQNRPYLVDLESKIKLLEPLKSLPLNLDLYHDYQSLDVLVGSVHSNPVKALQESIKDNFELFESDDKSIIALFVLKKDAELAQRALVQSGYTEIPIPNGSGSPSEQIAALESSRSVVQKDLDQVNTKLNELREKNASLLLAVDEYLSIIVEKSELPLRMGETEHSFILEAWAPSVDIDKIKTAFSQKVGEDVYIDILETRNRKAKEEEEPEMKAQVQREEAGALTSAANLKEEIKDEPPVELKNNKEAGRFEFFVKINFNTQIQ